MWAAVCIQELLATAVPTLCSLFCRSYISPAEQYTWHRDCSREYPWIEICCSCCTNAPFRYNPHPILLNATGCSWCNTTWRYAYANAVCFLTVRMGRLFQNDYVESLHFVFPLRTLPSVDPLQFSIAQRQRPMVPSLLRCIQHAFF